MVIIKKFQPNDDLKQVIVSAAEGLGGFVNFIKSNDKVLIKPNINTADPYPAGSDPVFIKAVIELVLETGAGQVIVGDSSTFTQNTRKNFEKLGLFELEKLDPKVKVISFDEGKWVSKKIAGKYLKKIGLPEILSQVDKLILLPCLKTHFIAQFTGALKLGVGLMKRSQRLPMHASHTIEKVAELNLAYKPDLIIMDGRKCFITKGPSEGEVREPNKILASTSRVEIDIEAIKIIQSFGGNDLANINPQDLPQVKHAIEIGIN